MVAGNLLRMPYSGLATHRLICRVSRCTRQPFPAPLPGINDWPECQPSKQVIF